MVKKISIKEDADSSRARLNFKSAGINRVPEKDFSDDGTRFRMYEYDGVPISYTTYDGDGYLSIRVDELASGLNYYEYSKLPSYREADKYNGVPIRTIDLEDVKRICKKLKAEYEKALGDIANVDYSEASKVINKIKSIHEQQCEDVLKLIADDPEKLLNLSEYRIKQVREYFAGLRRLANIDETKMSQSEKRRHILLQDDLIKNAENSFYYRELLDMLK